MWEECTERKWGCWGTSLAPDKCCLNGREGALGQSQEHVPWEALPALPALWVGAAFLANPPAPPHEECSPPPGLWSHKAGPSAGLSPWQNSLMLKIDYATERTRERPFYEPKEAVAWGFLSSSEGPGTLREGHLMARLSKSQRNTREASGLTSISGRTNWDQGDLSSAPFDSLSSRVRGPLAEVGLLGAEQSAGWGTKDPGAAVSQPHSPSHCPALPSSIPPTQTTPHTATRGSPSVNNQTACALLPRWLTPLSGSSVPLPF